jgi:glycosyltransferase involved in cell wall biosynthesis
VEFRFIGRIPNPKGAELLRQHPNVVIAGPKNISELPKHVKHFSAGIIPFKKTEAIKTVYPLKINEYLAAGVPVVTTNFAYLDDFETVVRLAENKEEFKACLVDELNTDSLEKKRARQDLAKQNSWEHRAIELSQVITELESEKKGKA